MEIDGMSSAVTDT